MILIDPSSSIFWGCVAMWLLLAFGRFAEVDHTTFILCSLAATAITIGSLINTRQQLSAVMRPGGIMWRVVVYAVILVSVLTHMAQRGPSYSLWLTSIYFWMCVAVLRNVVSVVHEVDEANAMGHTGGVLTALYGRVGWSRGLVLSVAFALSVACGVGFHYMIWSGN